MKIKTRLAEGETMYFIYGNEIRSTAVESIVVKQENKKLEILFGFTVIYFDGEEKAEKKRMQYLDGRNCFSSVEKLVEAHIKRHDDRAKSSISAAAEEDLLQNNDEGYDESEEANFQL